MTRHSVMLLICLLAAATVRAAGKYDNPDTIIVARDGTGQFRNINDAIEVCRAFMDYHKVIFVKRGVYKEKVIVPSWLTNIEICGEDRDQTIITYDDHANIALPATQRPMGTFRTYTLKIEGCDITLKNITVKNNAARLGQAVALHTEGDRLRFVHCRFLGNQDTVYTGMGGTRLAFDNCYIEGTTDFIFGPSTAWFDHCTLHCKANSYITAASTPANQPYGYVFSHCTITADTTVTKVFLGRPWRPYACTLFMNCELPSCIRPQGWANWENPDNERTARYAEYNNYGPGADTRQRVPWSRQLSAKEAKAVTPERVFELKSSWNPMLP